jgi:hypothetical protein
LRNFDNGTTYNVGAFAVSQLELQVGAYVPYDGRFMVNAG